MMNEDKTERTTDTGGGAYVEGDAIAEDGDLVGHAQIQHVDGPVAIGGGDATDLRGSHGAVVGAQGPVDVQFGDRIYARSDSEELADYLTQAVAAFEARMYRAVARSAARPEQPYKFLYAFEIEDGDIFFGRDAASEVLHRVVLKDRLTILHAKSGAGKTSLLNAGLAPRLIRGGRLPVYSRAYDDLTLAIKQAVAPPSLGPWPKLMPKLTLHEFLGMAHDRLSAQTQELVVILDQFEEFFISHPRREHRQALSRALGDCYKDRALPIRFVISLRGEYFTDLADFQDQLSNIFHNDYHLTAMSRDEAYAAITGPVSQLDCQVDYEPALLDTLLDDLDYGEVELPHLQIVCTRLYETLPSGQTTITLAAYDKMEGGKGMLGRYLDEVLTGFPNVQERIAREVLKELVSSKATKRVVSRDLLGTRVRGKAGLAEIEETELDAILARLVDARLLQRNEETGAIQYEVAHDYLAEQVERWIDQDELAVKQAEELLKREMENWRASETLMSADHLRVIASQSSRVRLDSKEREFLLHSALANAHEEVVHWWNQYPNPTEATESVASFLLGNDRQRAWRLADKLWPENRPLNKKLDPLVERIKTHLDSSNPQPRQRAWETQVFIGPVARQALGGHLQFLKTAFRLLVPDRWPAIIMSAFGGALGGLVGGIILSLLGQLTGTVDPGGDLWRLIVIQGPALAGVAAFIGAGSCMGRVLARGRSLVFEIIGASCVCAVVALLVACYFILLSIMNPPDSTPLALLDLGVLGAIYAAAIVVGMRLAERWGDQGERAWKKVIKQVLGAVLTASTVGIARDIWLGSRNWDNTLLAAVVGACFAAGLSLAECRLLASDRQKLATSDTGKDFG